MAADDLKLQLVIQAILDAKGFEEAKTALSGLADTTNKAVGPVKEMSEAQNVSRREIRLATAEVLRYSGVTQEAGLIGRLAATGFVALGDAAETANFAIVGATLGLSVLIPLIIEWMGKSKEATEDQKALEEAFKHETDALQPYLDKLRDVNAEWAKMAQQKQHDALVLQIGDLEKAGDAMNRAQEEVDRLNKRIKEGIEVAPGRRFFNPDDIDALAKARIALNDATIHYRLLDEAQKKHLTEQQLISSTTKKDTGVVEENTKARKQLTEDEKRAADFAKQAERDQILDMVAFGVAQTKAWKKETQDLGKHNNDLVEADAQAARERKAIDDRLTQAAIDDANRMADAKVAAVQRTVSASISLLGTLFGKNKAAASANVIIDTAEAIMRTNAQLGWPAAIPFDIALAAEGAAQLANINKAGFDDPMSDMIASKLGRKSAADFVRLFGEGFNTGLVGMNGGSVQHTTVNRGVTVQSLHMSGILGVNETDVMKNLNRKLIAVQRLEARTSLGR